MTRKTIKRLKSKATNKVEDEDDDSSKPKFETNLVYKTCHYNTQYSPMIIDSPSDYILYKIMRACIGIQKKEDLWIYDKSNIGDDSEYYKEDDIHCYYSNHSDKDQCRDAIVSFINLYQREIEVIEIVKDFENYNHQLG